MPKYVWRVKERQDAAQRLQELCVQNGIIGPGMRIILVPGNKAQGKPWLMLVAPNGAATHEGPAWHYGLPYHLGDNQAEAGRLVNALISLLSTVSYRQRERLREQPSVMTELLEVEQ